MSLYKMFLQYFRTIGFNHETEKVKGKEGDSISDNDARNHIEIYVGVALKQTPTQRTTRSKLEKDGEENEKNHNHAGSRHIFS